MGRLMYMDDPYSSGAPIATTQKAGVVKPDGTSITVDTDGTLHSSGGGGQFLTKANPEGSGSLSLNRKSDTTVGTDSIAIGLNTTASGDYSYAEGDNTTASGIGAHAEGQLTVAHAPYSHAEGKDTMTANEGQYVAMYAHVEGWGSVANNFYEHAEGRWNVSNVDSPSQWGSAGNTLHSVGIGTSITEKKNAFEIMQNGDAYLNGVGNYDGTTITGASTLQSVLGGLNGLSFWKGTQAQYDDLPSHSATTVYFITEE